MLIDATGWSENWILFLLVRAFGREHPNAPADWIDMVKGKYLIHQPFLGFGKLMKG